MEAPENGLGGATQTSVITAVKVPAASKKNSWKTKYLILKGKCDQIDQSNDVLYAKSRQIYKMIQRAEMEKKVLVRRLEQYEEEVGEDHVGNSVHGLNMAESFSPPPSFPLSTLPHSVFTSPTPDPSEPDLSQTLRQDMAVPSPSATTHQPTLASRPTHTNSNQLQPPPSKRPHLSSPVPPTTSSASPATKPAKRTPKSSARGSQSSRRKKDADSNAPKKPSNAFFWFCQEQRGSLEEQFRGEGVAGQHSLTKILAQKWGETTAEDKKIYYLKYTEDKKRYDREMQAYHQKKQLLQEQLQQQISAIETAPPAATT